MLQREGAREKGIQVSSVFDCCNSVLRYGGWNNGSVATDIKFKLSRKKGCCNEKGRKGRLIFIITCCNMSAVLLFENVATNNEWRAGAWRGLGVGCNTIDSDRDTAITVHVARGYSL